jgi:hypothetical protein
MPVYTVEMTDRGFYVVETDGDPLTVSPYLPSIWLIHHHPIRVFSEYPDCDTWDIDSIVRYEMARHGIDRVRGGNYMESEFDEATMTSLNRFVRDTTRTAATMIQSVVRMAVVKRMAHNDN